MDENLIYNPNENQQHYPLRKLKALLENIYTTSLESTNQNKIKDCKVFEPTNKTILL